MFVSLGSIIGSGWLLGALNAAETAGPASIISWIIAAAMLERAGAGVRRARRGLPGRRRQPDASRTTPTAPLAGFTAGWASWLQAVSIAPIEMLAAITYVNSIQWVNENFAMLHATGQGRTAQRPRARGRGHPDDPVHRDQPGRRQVHVREQRDRRDLEDRRAVAGDRRGRVPAFHAGQLHRRRRLHAVRLHGVFAALPGGVVFALQGFEQAVQLAGEARNPKGTVPGDPRGDGDRGAALHRCCRWS